MLKELVKIANRLDSLGLSKEADILDSYIQKLAGEDDIEWGGMSKMPEKSQFEKIKEQAELAAKNAPQNLGQSFPERFPDPIAAETLRSYLDRAKLINPLVSDEQLTKYYNKLSGETQPQPSAMHAEPAKTGWDRYVTQLRGGDKVKEAWFKLVDAGTPEVDKRFSSYVEWYNSRKRTDWGGKHASPEEVIKLLKKETDASKYGFTAAQPESDVKPIGFEGRGSFGPKL